MSINWKKNKKNEETRKNGDLLCHRSKLIIFLQLRKKEKTQKYITINTGINRKKNNKQTNENNLTNYGCVGSQISF